jgi:hypothetical protein
VHTFRQKKKSRGGVSRQSKAHKLAGGCEQRAEEEIAAQPKIET